MTKADVIRGGPAADEAADRQETGRGGLLRPSSWSALLLAAGRRVLLAGPGTADRGRRSHGPVPAAAAPAAPAPGAPTGPRSRAADRPDLEARRPLAVPRHHPGHPRPPRPRRPVRGHRPRHRPRDRMGRRTGRAQAPRPGCLDRDRRQDRHGAARAALDEPERGVREGRAERPPRCAGLSRLLGDRPSRALTELPPATSCRLTTIAQTRSHAPFRCGSLPEGAPPAGPTGHRTGSPRPDEGRPHRHASHREHLHEPFRADPTRFSRATEAAVTKVPAVTAGFWVLKILTTGLGEAASDALVRWGGVVAVAATGLALLASLHRAVPRLPLHPRRVLAGGRHGRDLRHHGRRHPPLPGHPALGHLAGIPARRFLAIFMDLVPAGGDAVLLLDHARPQRELLLGRRGRHVRVGTAVGT